MDGVDFFSFINPVFVLKFSLRENMKLFKRFLLLIFCAFPAIASAQVASTLGNNLTAYNPGSGSVNNNNWNSLMNNRSGTTNSAKADFGNCNSLILRCAQPKCSGCTSLDLARPIVAGCVNSNEACKQYGDDLVEYISAQLVSNATARAQEQELAAQSAAAQAAAQQNSQQMAQMQAQMQQMQYEMQQQNSETIAQLQAALEEQKAINAQAIADATAAQQAQSVAVNAVAAGDTTDLSDAQIAAAQSGVSDDILAREKISGQILTKIENAEVALKSLKATMQDAFTYAGCDTRGNNCAGPKRVKTFKNKAQRFFEPYDEIIDELYEALEMSLAVGVDVSDVIMMLNGSCNQWGKFLCTGSGAKHATAIYTEDSCSKNGRSIKGGYAKVGDEQQSDFSVAVKGGQECSVGMTVPPQDDVRCTLTEMIGGSGDNDPVLREWLDENYEGDRLVRVGCATSALESISIFGRRNSRNGATLDLDTLERILAQDAPDRMVRNKYSQNPNDTWIEKIKYCSLTPRGYQNLQTAIGSKKMPSKVCVPYKSLAFTAETDGVLSYDVYGNSGLSDSGVMSGMNEASCGAVKRYVPLECNLRWADGQCVYDTDKCKQGSSDDGVILQKISQLNQGVISVGGGDCRAVRLT